jgi:hypothetical protein
MDVRHSIEIIAKVDGVQVHRVVMDLQTTGPASDAMAGFDPVMAVVRALRQEAALIEKAVRREGRHAGFTVVDAVVDASALPPAGGRS